MLALYILILLVNFYHLISRIVNNFRITLFAWISHFYYPKCTSLGKRVTCNRHDYKFNITLLFSIKKNIQTPVYSYLGLNETSSKDSYS